MLKRGCVVVLLIVASACGGNSRTSPTPTRTPDGVLESHDQYGPVDPV
jgi:hypothetical protein